MPARSRKSEKETYQKKKKILQVAEMILELVIFLTINCILGIFHPVPTLPLDSDQ